MRWVLSLSATKAARVIAAASAIQSLRRDAEAVPECKGPSLLIPADVG
jgi:hypothetical protein